MILKLYLKKAEAKDCDLLFHWSNDRTVRLNSFNQDEIKYDEHVKWFNKKINSDTCCIYILYSDNLPVGQVRIDIENNEAVISYSIDKNYRGRGLSSKMLSLLEVRIKEDSNWISTLIAYVKYNNITSQSVFQKLGYLKQNCNEFIKYYKLL